MLKWFLISLILISLIGCWASPVVAELITPAKLAEELDLTDLKEFSRSLDNDTRRYLPSLDPKTWGLTGPNWDIGRIGKGILAYLIRELVFNLRLLGELLLIAMALAVLQNLRAAFEADTVSHLAFGISFMVIMGLVLNSYRVTFEIARDTLESMNNFMYAILPIVFSLIAASGGLVTVSIAHPLLISSVGLMVSLVNKVIFPLLIFAGVLGMVNYLVEGFQVNKLAQLFKKAALGILGAAMAVFIGLVTIRGFAAAVADSTALRTAKYFSNTFLPVVGGSLADTMEMAAGCSMILKSGLGIYGLGLITIITIFPLVKILAVGAIYHLTSAIIQPLGNNRLADALQVAGDTMVNLFGALAVVALMFFIALAVLIGVSNYRMG